MKRFLLSAFLILGAVPASHAVIYNYVQVSTKTTITPPRQAGAMNVSSGTIVELTVGNFASTGTFTATNVTATTATVTNLAFTSPGVAAISGDFSYYLSSCTSSGNRFSASNGNWVNVGSLSLAIGDWVVSGMGCTSLNGATSTSMAVAVSQFSGNTTTDQVNPYNGTANCIGPTSVGDACYTIAPHQILLSGSNTVYIKVLSNFSAGTTQIYGCVEARRLR